MLNKKQLQAVIKHLQQQNIDLKSQTSTLQAQIDEIIHKEDHMDDVLIPDSLKAADSQTRVNQAEILGLVVQGFNALFEIKDALLVLLEKLKNNNDPVQVRDLVTNFLREYEYWTANNVNDSDLYKLIDEVNINNKKAL